MAYKDYNKCIEDCDKALAISPTYAKAFHRKAKALVGLSTFFLIESANQKHTAVTRRSLKLSRRTAR